MSLAEQAAIRLRELIAAGRFVETLPPERSLCELLEISRPIIRQALHRLAEEGVVRIRQSRCAEIVLQHSGNLKGDDQRRVVLLYSDPAGSIPNWQLQVIDHLRQELYHRDYHLELLIDHCKRGKRSDLSLDRLLTQQRAHHWILAGAVADTRRWFRQKALNIVLMGSPSPEDPFPFVNTDLRGTSRHAAGVFLGMGHRSIAFMMRERGSAGEADEEAGFRDAFRATHDAAPLIVKHAGRVEQIHKRLKHLFLGEQRATALLISHAEDTLTALNWFLHAGIAVPDEVSLISFQWEAFLERVRPLPAAYHSDPAEHARKLCRLIFRPSAGRRSPKPLFPVFSANQTLAHRAASANHRPHSIP